jgi:integrase/recombinase XerD
VIEVPFKRQRERLTFDAAFKDFLSDRQSKDASAATLANYRGRFGLFADWCREQGVESVEDVTGAILKQYFLYLHNRPLKLVATMADGSRRHIPTKRTPKPWTVKSHFLSLAALFGYLAKWERIPADPTEAFEAGREFRIPRQRQYEKFCPSVEQMTRIVSLFNPDRPPDMYRKEEVGEKRARFLCVRNRTLLLFMAATAIRAHEVLSLTMADLDMDAGAVRVLRKGQKKDDDPRIITVTPSVRVALREYLMERDEVLSRAEGRLFVTVEGEGMGRTALRRMFHTIRNQTGVPVTPHLLRHFAVTEAWKAPNANPREVQAFADHADLKTTLGYSHHTLAEARAFAERADLAGKLLKR